MTAAKIIVRDKNKKPVVYKKSKTGCDDFEIQLARNDERMSRLDSNVQDAKSGIADLQKAQAETHKLFVDFVANAWPHIKGVGEKVEDIEKRLTCAEQVTMPFNWFSNATVKYWPILTAIGTAIVGLVIWVGVKALHALRALHVI